MSRSRDSGPRIAVDLGAGQEALTAPLAAVARRLVAVERDPAWAHVLRVRFADDERVQVIEGDLLRVPLPGEPYTVVLLASAVVRLPRARVGRPSSKPSAGSGAILAFRLTDANLRGNERAARLIAHLVRIVRLSASPGPRIHASTRKRSARCGPATSALSGVSFGLSLLILDPTRAGGHLRGAR